MALRKHRFESGKLHGQLHDGIRSWLKSHQPVLCHRNGDSAGAQKCLASNSRWVRFPLSPPVSVAYARG